MPSTLIGSPAAGSKLLRSSSHAKDNVGIETIAEVYTVRFADVPSIIPEYDSAHPTYGTMVVDGVSISRQEGDLATMQVNYVGITGSLPRATLRALPTDGAITYFNPWRLELTWVDLLSSAQTLAESNQVLLTNQFRGITLPGQFRAPFSEVLSSTENSTADYYKEIGWTILGNSSYTGPAIEQKSKTTNLVYEGVRRLSFTFEKRGLYAVYQAVYAEQYRITVSQEPT